MYGGIVALCSALVVIVLFGGSPAEAQSLSFASCPGMEVSGNRVLEAYRSELVYWTPPIPTSTNSDFVVHGTDQPGRYYYRDTTVTYTVEDSSDTAMCTFLIEIQDDGSPVITSCPMDMTASAPFGQSQVSVSWDDPTVADQANVQMTSTKSSNDLFDIGRNTVTYTFSFTNNKAAKSSFCSFDIFVQESESTTVPALQCPDAILVTLALGDESMAVTWDDPIYPDGLGSVTLACGRQKNDLFYEGRNMITCVGYFESGEARVCSFTVNVEASEDNDGPSIIDCPSDLMEYVAPMETGKVVTWNEPTIKDNTQQNLDLQASHTNGIFYNVGSYDVTYTGSDVSGNEVTCSFRVTVEIDDTPPIIHGCLASPVERFVKAGETEGTITWDEPSATDNADQNVELVGPTGDLLNGGTMNVGEVRSVSYVATDDFNNVQPCDFTVTLLVDQVPQYSECSEDMSFPADNDLSYTNVTWPEPRVTDDRYADQLILTKSHEPGMNYVIGVYVIEYTATDVIGNVGICSFVITVEDRQNPVVRDCPDSQSFVLDQSESSKNVMWMQPSATDNSCIASNCGTTLTVTSDINPGLFTVGTETVTVTATDPSGNMDTSCTFTITISPYVPDASRPIWETCPSPVGGDTDPGLPTRTINWGIPVASDDRGIVSEYASHTPPFAFGIGTMQTVTYRATDAAGNVGTCTFNIDVTDSEAPVWDLNSGCGTTIRHFVLSDRTTNLELALPSPSATDNSGVATVSNSLTDRASYPFSSGTETIQYRAVDNSGNFVQNCEVIVAVSQVLKSDTWSVRGSVVLTQIRGVSGEFSDASSTMLLMELALDMDQLFRDSSIRSDFVGIDSLSHTFDNGNPQVFFTLYFTKDRQGRHTTRQIMEAFYAALTSTNTFDTRNAVVANTLQFYVREFKLTTKIIAMETADNEAVFISQYDNPSSGQYTALVDRINTAMDEVLAAVFAYKVSVVVDFRSGSIDNDVILVFDSSSATTEAGIMDQFNSNLDSDGQLRMSGLFYNRATSALNQELCPDGECQNGGTCAVDATYTNVCTCPEGYSGPNCETETPTTVLSTVVIAAIIGGSILLLILLFALCCCCLYFCRDLSGPYKDDRYPLERPFQIVDDEASVASSMDVFMMPRERYYLEPPTPILALPPPQPPILSLPPPPPREAPTLRLNDDMGYGRGDDMGYGRGDDMGYGRGDGMYPMDRLPSDGPSFSPDGEVYVTGPNQVAIRPSTKRGHYYRY